MTRPCPVAGLAEYPNLSQWRKFPARGWSICIDTASGAPSNLASQRDTTRVCVVRATHAPQRTGFVNRQIGRNKTSGLRIQLRHMQGYAKGCTARAAGRTMICREIHVATR